MNRPDQLHRSPDRPHNDQDPPQKLGGTWDFTGADDRVRTGDLNLGKVALYQLSYVRSEA